MKAVSFGILGIKANALLAKWRNWQTRRTQNPFSLTGSEGSSPSLATFDISLIEQQSHATWPPSPTDGDC